MDYGEFETEDGTVVLLKKNSQVLQKYDKLFFFKIVFGELQCSIINDNFLLSISCRSLNVNI